MDSGVDEVDCLGEVPKSRWMKEKEWRRDVAAKLDRTGRITESPNPGKYA